MWTGEGSGHLYKDENVDRDPGILICTGLCPSETPVASCVFQQELTYLPGRVAQPGIPCRRWSHKRGAASQMKTHLLFHKEVVPFWNIG